jgi:hypothetical protein
MTEFDVEIVVLPDDLWSDRILSTDVLTAYHARKLSKTHRQWAETAILRLMGFVLNCHDKIVDLPTISRLFSMSEVEALARLPYSTTVNEVHTPGASFFRKKFTHKFNVFDAHARLQEPNSTTERAHFMFSCWGALTAGPTDMSLVEVPIFTHTILLDTDTYAQLASNSQ